MTQLDEARHEVQDKTRSQIEEETAYKWAACAVAAHENYELTDNVSWLRDCQDYFHEAVEHAALADQSGAVLRAVRTWVHRYIPRGDV